MRLLEGRKRVEEYLMIIRILQTILLGILRVYELMLVARAILSWFPMLGGTFMDMLCMLTEPILSPIRKLLWKIPALQSFPIDMSVLVAFLLIDVIRTIIFYL